MLIGATGELRAARAGSGRLAAGVTSFVFGCADYCDKSSIWQLEHHLRG
jgi:hypothetical protein